MISGLCRRHRLRSHCWSSKQIWESLSTASHNPASDNGIKLFDGRGCKFDPVEEARIEALIDAEPSPVADLPMAKSLPIGCCRFLY